MKGRDVYKFDGFFYSVQCSTFLLCALIGHLVRKCPGKIYLSVVVDVAPNLQTEPEFENV
jgi:hypothetical protein